MRLNILIPWSSLSQSAIKIAAELAFTQLIASDMRLSALFERTVTTRLFQPYSRIHSTIVSRTGKKRGNRACWANLTEPATIQFVTFQLALLGFFSRAFDYVKAETSVMSFLSWCHDTIYHTMHRWLPFTTTYNSITMSGVWVSGVTAIELWYS